MSSSQAFPSFELAINKHWYFKYSVSQTFFFYVFRRSLTFWPQNTIPPEIPQAQAIAPNPPVPVVRAAILRVRIKIRVSFFLRIQRVHF